MIYIKKIRHQDRIIFSLKESIEVMRKKICQLDDQSIYAYMILHSTQGIVDGLKFTAQFQISGQLLKFYYPCNNCGCLYNNILHAYVDCPALSLVKQFLKINLSENKIFSPSILKAYILFGPYKVEKSSPSSHKALNAAVSNIKSLIAKQLTANSYVEAEDLRAIILGAAVRYEALDVKIPDPGSPSWKWVGDIVRFVPSRSGVYLKALKRILRRHRDF
eukprot:TRINITY_DN7371_c0_g1_i4.p1 TRINITY_DN7371_c0_g1~~TRINITY_DN7371_c0_g1_i4.p1  ORF type:complete len:219 (-),score=-28.30 TRINITY_DN7371_c0_g1_i4:357-1013(-)